MNDKQRTFGQYETPVDVADVLLGFCLRQPEDRLLDPSCGNGAFLARAARLQSWLSNGAPVPGTLWGVELDPELAMEAESAVPVARVIRRNFFQLNLADEEPFGGRRFSAIIGNPPYTRAEWIDRLNQAASDAWQAGFFEEEGQPPDMPPTRGHTVLNRRSGLHAYFLVHGTEFLVEGGRFGFVVPNSWLDVAYGERLKQFLLDHFCILAIIESSVERWFSEARVNTCLLVLEKNADANNRAQNQVHLVRLLKPLSELITIDLGDPGRIEYLHRFCDSLLPGTDHGDKKIAVRVISQDRLAARERWGVLLRAPAVYRKASHSNNLVPLGQWATVQRGYTTGANNFFYLDEETIERWKIEPEFRRPLLKSLRLVKRRITGRADCQHQLLCIPADSGLSGTGAGAYVAWADEQGLHKRRSLASRQPWYSLSRQEPAPLLLAKGIWGRHFAPLLSDDIEVDQQLYRIQLADGVMPITAAALLNSAWVCLQLELNGRVNFGEGVLWMAAYELQELRVPDPRYMLAGQLNALVDAFEPLLALPVSDVNDELESVAWQAFNAVIFEILRFSDRQANSIINSLHERVTNRQLKAISVNA